MKLGHFTNPDHKRRIKQTAIVLETKSRSHPQRERERTEGMFELEGTFGHSLDLSLSVLLLY